MSGYAFSAVVQGALHKKEGLECQDFAGSCGISQKEGFVFAISDGHGDPACLRSAIGSQFAVEVALGCLSEFAQGICIDGEQFDIGKLEVSAKELCEKLVSQWLGSTKAHLDSHPLTAEQWQSLGEREQQITKDRPAHLYGATLVAGLVTDRLLLLVQQGDGCCVVMDSTGDLRSPLPEDERCIGNVTTSLCDADAARRMRICVIDTKTSPVIACFVGSDGVDKSLWGIEGLYDLCGKLALDTLGNLSQQDMEENLTLLLNELSERGCGDDASLAGFADVSRIAPLAPVLVNHRMCFVMTSELEQARSQLNSMKRLRERFLQTEPKSQDEERRRTAFFKEYSDVENRIQGLEEQLSRMDSIPENQPVAVASSFSNTSSSVRIKPAAHFPKSHDFTAWEMMEEQEETHKTDALETSLVPDAQQPELSRDVVETPRKKGGIRAVHLAVTSIVVAALFLGAGVVLGRRVLAPNNEGSSIAVEQKNVTIASKAQVESAQRSSEDQGVGEDRQAEQTTTSADDFSEPIREFIQDMGATGREIQDLEEGLGLIPKNELLKSVLGTADVTVREYEPIGDVALVRVDISCGDLHEALKALTMGESRDEEEVTPESLARELGNGYYSRSIPATFCLKKTNDVWEVDEEASRLLDFSVLFEESGYVDCLRYMSNQKAGGQQNETTEDVESDKDSEQIWQ